MWTDVIPGGTYTILVDNGCGQTDIVTVTLPLGNVQNQSITASVQQLCGGTGNISVAVNIEGAGSIAFDLLDSNNDIVGSGTAPGNTFTNLPAGVYHAVAHVTGCGPYNFSETDIEILGDGSLPVITKKIGMICEDGSGNPSSEGKAIFSFIGAQPLSVDYRLTSQTDDDYVMVTNNSDGSETIEGLLPNTSYTVRVTDNCGNSNPTQISIGQLSALTSENSDRPCIDEEYTLSVPDMIDATYEWTKNGVVISNERAIHFPNYSAGDDGVYICQILIADCVVREVTINLVNCTLPVSLISFNAKLVESAVNLGWSTTAETNSDRFEIERSSDAKVWQKIATVSSTGESNQLVNYKYVDRNPVAEANYYRLRMIDKDATYSYSRIVSIGIPSLSKAISTYPNPVSDKLYLNENTLKNLQNVQLIDVNGTVLSDYDHQSAAKGIDVRKYSAGIYMVQIQLKNGVVATHKILISK